MHKEFTMSFVTRVREHWTKVAAATLILLTAMSPLAAQADTSQPRDANSNSIMWAGAYSKTEFLGKVASGDGHNTAANLQQIYYKEGRGITEANFKSGTTVDGTVYKDGRVVVGGKTVATNAKSTGRDFIAGSTKSGSVWIRPTNVAFAVDSIQAWVNLDGGKFHYFVLKSCGNTGEATPTPSPTPTPSQPDVDHRPSVYRFTVTPQTQNVTVTGYRFTFSDHTPQATTAANTPYVDKEVKSGTLKVSAQALTNKGETAISEVCSASVTANTTPSPTNSPVVLGTSTQPVLPQTGAETALGGLLGLTAIGAAGRAYWRSRKSLTSALRHTR
jgi:LPXTG-motif cell wall-anchored protein